MVYDYKKYDWDFDAFADIKGKVLKSVKYNKDAEEINFIAEDGSHYCMWHEQDCCESVSVESIVGDLEDLVGNPILVASEETNRDGEPKDEYEDSFTWTFYKFATIKGHVDIRWYGSSNGYYNESVNFARLTDGE